MRGRVVVAMLVASATGLASAGCWPPLDDLAGAGVAPGHCASAGAAFDFCADFDQVATATEGWTTFDDDPSISGYELDDAIWVSPGHSARMSIAAGSSECSYARLQQAVSGSETRFRFGFDVHPDLALTGNVLGAGAVSYRVGGAVCNIILFLGAESGSVYLQEQQGETKVEDSLEFEYAESAANGWSRLDLSVEIEPGEPGTASFALVRDGSTALAQTLTRSTWLACAATPEADTMVVSVGPFCHQGGLAQSAHYDNVVFGELE